MTRSAFPYVFCRKRLKDFPLLSRFIPRGRKVIAHSGHRHLVDSELQHIQHAVWDKLLEITQGNYKDFILVSGIADGADSLVVTKALEMGLKVLLLLLPEDGDEERVKTLTGKFGTTLISTRSLSPYITEERNRRAAGSGMQKIAGGDNIPYKVLAGCLVNIAEYLIVLWDGVDTGKEGGTSDVVNMAMEAEGKRCKSGRLYQLIVSRAENDAPLCGAALQRERYFPPPDKLEWAEVCFPQFTYKSRIPWWKKNVIYNENFRRFVLPLFWVLLTVSFGTWGFILSKKPDNYPEYRDAFFSAVNLLTFNSSVGNEPREAVVILDIARFSGLAFFVNAFLIAFFLAIGSNNKSLLYFFVWKWFSKDRICMITGLNSITYLLAITLKREHQKVMIIDKAPDPNLKTEAAKRGIRVVEGSPQSSTFLRRNRTVNAHTVYLLEESDADNIRTLQELDLMWAKQSRRKHCYIHLKDDRAAEFVGKLNPLSGRVVVRRLNFHEIISRKLLIRYPIYRDSRDAWKPTEILLFGFGDMGKQLLVTLLHTIQLNSNHHVNITVFAQGAVAAEAEFYQQYPCLWYNPHENLLYEAPYTREIRKEIFPKGRITFKELPVSDAGYYNDEVMLRALKEENLITAYFCLEDALKGAAYLHGFLGKIAARYFNLQIFSYCNLADESEFENISHMLNRQLPYTPVILFGQLVDECRALAKGNASIDDLPALINLWYANMKDKTYWKENPVDIMRLARQEWETLSYTYKESNRRAADHIWVKLRYTSYSLQKIKQALTANDTSAMLFEYFSMEANPACRVLFELLSKTEQHRWCAEKLLNGFLPLQDYDPGKEDVETRIVRWNNERGYKALYQSQKLHIDLVPYDKLSDVEKSKDRSQINGIPYFIHVLAQNNIL
ncbi:NAD-binding protein [Chitinophaga filiformis]|uniref:TrkA-N domain-containing protein n=1 Tax=Chitinophaga filiformis TaxID=104663 RepID=A0A1G7P6G8_CHIFI|nr:NAD-binding protein [Chitinophaga filiformis]SDF81821.1 TrkA-N domain-containing protein [Chitinophaga filiformis]